MSGPRILLVIGGGIAAYKSCELVRLIRKAGASVTCVLTDGGAQFVTPMSLAALSENKVYTSLFDLKDEVEMGHIQLSREADLVVVCPATANMLAKMAAGIADDLATTLILATDKPVLAVPAMNVRMWEHEATQRNAEWLRQAGVTVVDPDEGPMACGEFGPGRLPEPHAILRAIADKLDLDIEMPGLPAPDRGGEWLDVPEEEDLAAPPARGGGLGSLLSAIIPRSTERRSHDDLEAELDALPDFDEAAPGAAPETSLEFDPSPDALDTGPLLATKGKAAAAPPTDREAINHEVGRQVAPESDPVFDPPFDPLDGQAEFDTDPAHRPLYGRHVLVTAGPTHEAIDPVRYIANRSSGKQGFAIAAMAAAAGARVTLIAGPVYLPTPLGVDRVDVENAEEMAEAVRAALPADAAFMVAAVADWKASLPAGQKIKKRGSRPPALELAENPDILASLGQAEDRPALLIGFAAETENVVDNAVAKRARKGADWIVANDVADTGRGSVMGGDRNRVHIVTKDGVETLDEMPKQDVARELVRRAAAVLEEAHD